ncbi:MULTISPECIES: arginine--tRNA ligase [Paenibacillus]|uniref:Arginine--tRNA ligase n=1 Tax=Paenibacillus albilobatus TaxID=2716884 RepID=A0A920CAA7_9BACL|nr:MULTISPECIES: arginine--tRNA ligase [Paenibacillus]GIO29904.1 arginine--tRNA ligase 1 [Paenibacillus albilobatus]
MLYQWAANALNNYVPLEADDISGLLEIPPSPEMGDMALPCFVLAKSFRKAPQEIARSIAEAFSHPHMTAAAAGPYVNLTFDREHYGGMMMDELAQEKVPQTGKGIKAVIDMSSPNIAKPFGIGHLRSTMIGAALYNMHKLAGYDVVSVNHLGDWGTQFGKQIAAYKRWGNDDLLAADPIGESLKLYVRFHEEAEHDDTLEPEAREWFRKLEEGDEEARALWTYFVNVSMKEFDRMYGRLNVRFDYTLGESFYNDKMPAVVKALKEKGLLVESDGALVVRLDDEGMPPCLILKKDGTTIYPTRDLATAIYRHDVMKADRILYVVGNEQRLHFQQVFAVLGKMGMDWADRCTHLPFGLMKFEGKKMSTRRGKIVKLEDVMDEAVERALAIINEKNPGLEQKERVAEAVGIGAIIFGDLKNHRLNEVDFSLEDALNFDGETGPYVQYTYARTQSVLAKGAAGKDGAADDAGTGEYTAAAAHLGDSGWELLKLLTRFPEQLERGVRSGEPSVLARYALDVAQSFNQFYNKERIVTDETSVRKARLRLTQLAGRTIARTMGLLGIQTPERM